MWWWEQAGIDLVGAMETEAEAPEAAVEADEDGM